MRDLYLFLYLLSVLRHRLNISFSIATASLPTSLSVIFRSSLSLTLVLANTTNIGACLKGIKPNIYHRYFSNNLSTLKEVLWDLPLVEDVCQRAADVLSHLVVGWRWHGRRRGHWSGWMWRSGGRVTGGSWRGWRNWRWWDSGGWVTVGWHILLLWLLLRNSEVGLGDPQRSCHVDRTWRVERLGMDGRRAWFLGLRPSFTRRCCRFLGCLWASSLRGRLLVLRGNLGCSGHRGLLASFDWCCWCWGFLRSRGRFPLFLLFFTLLLFFGRSWEQEQNKDTTF